MEDDVEDEQARLHIYIRSRQLQYLEYLSERDGDTFSRAFAKVVERAEQQLFVENSGRVEEIRKHVRIPMTALEFINLLSARWGISRSDVVRRLVDDALARDPTL